MTAVPSVRHAPEGYDVIGDVHGQHVKLVGLLRHLGYAERDGLWSHPDRRAVFVGDLVDRGPGQLEALDLARRMVDAGTALIVMGNHEYNAIAWATLRPDGTDHLRPRLGKKGPKNYRQHAAFLAQVGTSPAQHREWIDWFRTLPLWLDLDGLRVVHACWHQPSMEVLLNIGVKDDGGRWLLDDRAMVATALKDGDGYEALEIVLKGPEVRLPEGFEYRDKSGTVRKKARTNWWNVDEPPTLANVAHIPSDAKLADGSPYPRPLPDTPLDVEVVTYPDQVPLVFGHYWAQPDEDQTKYLGSSHAVCVDLSAALDKYPLAAYRWSGETSIDGSNLVWVGKPTA